MVRALTEPYCVQAALCAGGEGRASMATPGGSAPAASPLLPAPRSSLDEVWPELHELPNPTSRELPTQI